MDWCPVGLLQQRFITIVFFNWYQGRDSKRFRWFQCNQTVNGCYLDKQSSVSETKRNLFVSFSIWTENKVLKQPQKDIKCSFRHWLAITGHEKRRCPRYGNRSGKTMGKNLYYSPYLSLGYLFAAHLPYDTTKTRNTYCSCYIGSMAQLLCATGDKVQWSLIIYYHDDHWWCISLLRLPRNWREFHLYRWTILRDGRRNTLLCSGQKLQILTEEHLND